ncbi:hypothetical protein [Pantoea stewartii]|uniref:hypothetical protein n=1 Tax=Pantoea stewartii TaxID=66269 RepID=UPI0025A24A36|nr:hypothetical protein [Pantoea stewartii]
MRLGVFITTPVLAFIVTVVASETVTDWPLASTNAAGRQLHVHAGLVVNRGFTCL